VISEGLYLEPLHQPFFVMDFFEIGSLELFPRLASNHDPPDLCLLSSQDYKHKLLTPSPSSFFYKDTSHIGWGPTLTTPF
jgi:hypothetical protein